MHTVRLIGHFTANDPSPLVGMTPEQERLAYVAYAADCAFAMHGDTRSKARRDEALSALRTI